MSLREDAECALVWHLAELLNLNLGLTSAFYCLVFLLLPIGSYTVSKNSFNDYRVTLHSHSKFKVLAKHRCILLLIVPANIPLCNRQYAKMNISFYSGVIGKKKKKTEARGGQSEENLSHSHHRCVCEKKNLLNAIFNTYLEKNIINLTHKHTHARKDVHMRPCKHTILPTNGLISCVWYKWTKGEQADTQASKQAGRVTWVE